jgi:transcriptional regulator with XRE-family HTH domain
MDMATIIREGRRKASLSQRRLADKMGVSPGAVGQWETSATLPSLANRIDLASILAIPFSSLLPETAEGVVSSKNPRTIALVRKFEALPPKVQESILMQVATTADALEAASKEPPAKK